MGIRSSYLSILVSLFWLSATIAGAQSLSRPVVDDDCGPLQWVATLFERPGGYSATAIDSNVVYGASLTKLDVIDFGSPNPVAVPFGTGLWSTAPFDVKVRGKLLLVISPSHVVGYDITGRTFPDLIFVADCPDESPAAKITGADLFAGHVYITTTHGQDSSGGGLYAVDLITQSEIIDTVFEGNRHADVHTAGTSLVVSRYDGAVRNHYIYRWEGGDLHPVDTFAIPGDAAIVDYDLDDTLGVFVTRLPNGDGTYHRSGIDIYSISPLEGARRLWSVDSLPMLEPVGAAIDEGRIVLHCNKRVTPFDPIGVAVVTAIVDQSGAPRFTDTLVTGWSRGKSIFASMLPDRLSLSGRFLMRYVAGDISVDTIDEAHRQIGMTTFVTVERALTTSSHGSNVYVLTADSLHVLDASAPESPVVTGSLPIIAEHIDGGGSRLFAYDSIVTLIDATQPAPTVVARGSMGRNVIGWSLAEGDSLIAVACFGEGLVIMQQKGTLLEVVDRIDVKAADVVWHGDRLYVADLEGRLSIWAFPDGVHGERLHTIVVHDRGGALYALAASGDTLFVGGSTVRALYRLWPDGPPSVIVPPHSITTVIVRAGLREGVPPRHLLFNTEFTGGFRTSRIDGTTSWETCGFYNSFLRDGRTTHLPGYSYIPSGALGLQIVRVERTTSVETPLDNAASLAITPNPAKDQATLRYSIDGRAAVGVELFDLTGKRVRSIAVRQVEAGVHDLLIDTGGLAAGSYYCRVTIDGMTHSLPLQVR